MAMGADIALFVDRVSGSIDTQRQEEESVVQRRQDP